MCGRGESVGEFAIAEGRKRIRILFEANEAKIREVWE
jgi:hypothetical protein